MRTIAQLSKKVSQKVSIGLKINRVEIDINKKKEKKIKEAKGLV